MVKNSRLVLAALAWAAPLVAGGPSTAAHSSAKAKCPKAHAKAAQAKVAKAKAKGGGMAPVSSIAPRLSVPEEGSFFSIGRGSLLAP